MERQKIYLRMKDLKEAREILFKRFNPEPIKEGEKHHFWRLEFWADDFLKGDSDG